MCLNVSNLTGLKMATNTDQIQMQGFVAQGPPQPGMPPAPPAYTTPDHMPRVAPIAGVPQGLEYLTQVDQLLVKQDVHLAEVFLNWESKNAYKIFNSMGQQVYTAVEESGCLDRQCCGPKRGFEMNIMDNYNNPVLKIDRPFKICASGACWCAGLDACAMELTVNDAQGHTLGYVFQRSSSWAPHLEVCNANKEPFARIRGPCCPCNIVCCGDIEFNVTNPNESVQFGKISKQWSGALKEIYTDADNFCVSFPKDMDVRCKATMIGALFLIDFMFFEHHKG